MANTPRLVTVKQADALAELYVWDTVVEILEGSTAPRDESGQKAARKVIAIAKAEQKKLFRKYDAEARHDDFAALQAEIDALRTRLEDTVRDSTNEIERLRAETKRLEKTLGAYQAAVNKIDDLIEYSLPMSPETKAALYAVLANLTATLAEELTND